MGVRSLASLLPLMLSVPAAWSQSLPPAPVASIVDPDETPLRLPDPTDTLPPVKLPEFLRPPDAPNPPREPRPEPKSSEPRTGPGTYDPSYLYLPEYVAPSDPPRRRHAQPCAPAGRFWVNGAFFYGTISNEDVPPLLGGGGSTLVGDPGVIVLAGEDRNSSFFRPGLLLSGGFWLNPNHTLALEGSLLLLEGNKAPYDFASVGTPAFGRAYLDGRTLEPATELIAAAGRYAGSASLLSESDVIGGEANFRDNLVCGKPWRVDVLAGYRFLRVSEAVELNSARVALASSPGEVEGTRVLVNDRFATSNDFHGGQIGLAGEYRWGSLYFDATGKVAFGVTRERIEIDGERATIAPGAMPVVVPYGLLTGPTNAGTVTEARFAVVPEVGLSAGYQISDHFRAYVGYTFLYASQIARPGHAIDTAVGNGRPSRRDAGEDFWMQGVNLGMELRY